MIDESYSLFAAAFVLGFSAGISPGVLFTVIVSESIQHGAKAGIKVAIAPLFTDVPIVVACYYIFSRLAEVQELLAIISFAGGLYLIYLGYKNIIAVPQLNLTQVKTNSIQKGIITNFLSPGPYVFWMSIGSPLLNSSFKINITTAVIFIAIFYVMLLSIKITIAILSSKVTKFIGGKIYIGVIKLLGVILIGLGLLYIYNGFIQIG